MESIIVDDSINKRKTNFLMLIFCFAISFVVLFVCSPNSPIYVFNDIHDTNWYISIGRGMLAGKVPYKDLFEQKGPLLYLIISLACLFKNSFIGIFILEIISIGLFLFVSYKILSKYLSIKLSIIGVILIIFITITSSYRVLGGGAVEEYLLPIITYILYQFINFLETKKPFAIFQNLLIGAGLAVIFWIKFAVLTAVISILVAYFIISLKNKKYKELTISILQMFAAFLAVSLLIFPYYIINGAMLDLIKCYFYYNIFLYNSKINFFRNIKTSFNYGPIVMLTIIAGFVCLVCSKKEKDYKILMILTFLITLFLVCLQKGFGYYFTQIIPYAVVPIAFILQFMAKQITNKKLKISLASIVLILCTFGTFFMSFTTENIFKTKKDFPQMLVAEEISQLSQKYNIANPTLFCYKIWDYGFYTAANIVPNNKYFANNVFDEEDFPEMYSNFKNYIENQTSTFLVTSKEVYEQEKTFLTEYYNYCDEYSYFQNNAPKDKKLNFVLLIKINI